MLAKMTQRRKSKLKEQKDRILMENQMMDENR